MNSFVYRNDFPVVETVYGKLRGFLHRDMYHFYGIHYAEAERFQPPVPPKSWEGIADATSYGYICPVEAAPAPQGEILIPHRFWPANEHCQNLNVWTKTLDKNAGLPVMVWFHGGGYANGSAMEQVAYEGDALARHEDVVVVTVNHRLNILGFLDMSSFGEKYRNSVNAGIADLVAALEWVRDNIAGFGGDPGNVTVFGQSGGGGKVETLMQTPAAQGLFHKAILMSGIMDGFDGNGKLDTNIDHRKAILPMMQALGIPEDQPEQLEKVPYDVLVRAFRKVHRDLIRQGGFISWGPKPNDWYLGDPMKVGFTDFARTVPTMAGTVIAEFSGGAGTQAPGTEEENLAFLETIYGGNARRYADLFRKAYPDKPVTLLPQLDVNVRRATHAFIAKKAEVSSAPAYLYVFALDFDVLGSRPAWHCSDLPFVFHNTLRVPNCDMDVREQLEKEMAGAWAGFARTGSPSHAALPRWDAYTEQHPVTMIFDRQSRQAADYDTELINTLSRELPRQDMLEMFAKMALTESDEGGGWMY